MRLLLALFVAFNAISWHRLPLLDDEQDVTPLKECSLRDVSVSAAALPATVRPDRSCKRLEKYAAESRTR